MNALIFIVGLIVAAILGCACLPPVVGWVSSRFSAILHSEYFANSWQKTHPIRGYLQKRWPRTYAFFRRRLDAKSFIGLPLAVLVISIIYLIALTTGWIVDVIFDPDVTELDVAINSYLSSVRSDNLTIVVKWITQFAHSATLVAVATTASGFIAIKRLWSYLLPMWMVVIGAIGMTWAFKYIFMRERPDALIGVEEWSPSFPSGHATGAVAVYGFVAYIIAREATKSLQRIRLAYLTVLLIFTIALSRMLLSVHFMSDIIVGLLIGSFWLLAGFTLREYWAARQTKENFLSK